MAETLHPNEFIGGGFSSAVPADLGSTDGTTTDASANNDYFAAGFPSTTGSILVTGAASQSFTIVAAKTSASGSNDATYSVDLYDGNTLIANLGTKALTSTTMSTDSFTWDGSQYGLGDNGASVRVRVTQTDGASGSPSKRAYVSVDEVYWTADSYEQISPAGINLRTVSGIDLSGATLDATHDAESGDLTGVTTETGTPTASSAQAYEGTYSYLCEGDPTTRDEFSVTLPVTSPGGGNWIAVDFWAYWNNGIPSTSGWLWCEDGLAADQWYLRAEGSSGATGQLQLSDANGTVQQNFDVNLSSATWYNFKILWKIANPSGQWYLEIRNSGGTLLYELNDSALPTLNGTNLANKLSFMGAGGTGTDVYQDLIKVYDGGEYLNSIPFGTATVAEASSGRTVTCTTEVVSAVANAATVNKQRGVNAGTEVVQASTNNATVLVGVTINGVTEAVSVTTSPAAVARDRLVAAVSEAVIAQTVNAIVNSTRNVDGVTETVLVTENNADVARDRTITGLTEVVQAVANSASVVRPRAVAAVTEVIVLTEVDASVSRGISVSGTVEEIVVTETSASVGKSRNVLGASEVVAVPVNGAGINRSRIVVGTTEVLQAIEAAASVNTTRNVDGATEIVTVTENAANVNLDRPVSGAVEVITVTENNATVTFSGAPRVVSGLTEAVTVSSVAAAINATRNVQASTEAVNATTNAAVVNTSRGVAGFVEALNVAMNTADINKARGVLGNTEVVVLEEYPATVELGPPPVVAQGRGISSDVGRHITIDITTDIT